MLMLVAMCLARVPRYIEVHCVRPGARDGRAHPSDGVMSAKPNGHPINLAAFANARTLHQTV